MFLACGHEYDLTESQWINGIPMAYMTLREASLECIQHVRFDEDAKSVFETERVRTQLEIVMGLVIKTLELVAQYFAKPMISTLSLLG